MRFIVLILLFSLTSCASLNKLNVDHTLKTHPELSKWRQKAIDREIEIGFPEALLKPIRIVFDGSLKIGNREIKTYIYKQRFLDPGYTQILVENGKVIAIQD